MSLNIRRIAAEAFNNEQKDIDAIISQYNTYGDGTAIIMDGGEKSFLLYRNNEVTLENQFDLLRVTQYNISKTVSKLVKDYVDNSEEHQNTVRNLNPEQLELIEDYLIIKLNEIKDFNNDLYENLNLDETLILANKDLAYGILNMELVVSKHQNRPLNKDIINEYLMRENINPITFKNILRNQYDLREQIQLYNTLDNNQKTEDIDLEAFIVGVPIVNNYNNNFYLKAFERNPEVVKFDNFPNNISLKSKILEKNIYNVEYFPNKFIDISLMRDILEKHTIEEFICIFSFTSRV